MRSLVSSLENENRYPFDNYSTDIDLLVTAPVKKEVQPLPQKLPDTADPLATTLVVGTNDLDRNETVPIKESLADQEYPDLEDQQKPFYFPRLSRSISARTYPSVAIQRGNIRVCSEILEVLIMNTPAILIALVCVVWRRRIKP